MCCRPQKCHQMADEVLWRLQHGWVCSGSSNRWIYSTVSMDDGCSSRSRGQGRHADDDRGVRRRSLFIGEFSVRLMQKAIKRRTSSFSHEEWGIALKRGTSGGLSEIYLSVCRSVCLSVSVSVCLCVCRQSRHLNHVLLYPKTVKYPTVVPAVIYPNIVQ